jgi:hypothetical protein
MQTKICGIYETILFAKQRENKPKCPTILPEKE